MTRSFRQSSRVVSISSCFFALLIFSEACSKEAAPNREKIESIEARLESRSALHAFANANKSRMLGMLYDSEQWEKLADGVWEFGINFDVSYLYLGRIALETEQSDLARRLLYKAIHHSPKHSCLFTDVCHSIDVRTEATLNLAKLDKKRFDSASEGRVGGEARITLNIPDNPGDVRVSTVGMLGAPNQHEPLLVASEAQPASDPRDPHNTQTDHIGSSQDGTVSSIKEAAAREAELQATLIENERLRQQLQDAQKKPSIDRPAAVGTPLTSIPDNAILPLEVKRHALIIGNDDYRNVPKLENAIGDARSIASLLSKLGYEVVAHINLGEKQFRAALRQFKQRLNGGEEVVFFFAGHGVQLGSTNYLLPIDVGSDSEEQIRDEGVPLQRVLDDFSESKVRFSLAMIDACRDNPFKSEGRAIGGRGLAPTSAANGQMIIFSAGAGQQALDRLGKDDKAKNGLFTRVLVDKVGKSKDPIHLLMRDVRSEVAKLAQTVGHEQVPAIYDQVIGDFYFIPRR